MRVNENERVLSIIPIEDDPSHYYITADSTHVPVEFIHQYVFPASMNVKKQLKHDFKIVKNKFEITKLD